VLIGKPQINRPLGVLGTHGRILLKQILEKSDMEVCSELKWLRVGNDFFNTVIN
jgi:hypothetical protein